MAIERMEILDKILEIHKEVMRIDGESEDAVKLNALGLLAKAWAQCFEGYTRYA